jgi:hypothetical protein
MTSGEDTSAGMGRNRSNQQRSEASDLPVLVPCLFQFHGDGLFWTEMGAKAAALAVIKIDDGRVTRFVPRDGLIRAHELTDLAALARPCGKTARRFGPCALSVKG